MKRHFSLMDQLCIQTELLLHALHRTDIQSDRPYPAQEVPASLLSDKERQHVSQLMRINHSGEVCAQALYLGQALVARDDHTREALNQAALEEGDHLLWCKTRINDLASRTSYLNPIWYGGSLFIGVIAGLAGDALSLGFIVETERQVERHLAGHLEQIPKHDEQTRAILMQMHEDEKKHGDQALEAGALTLPPIIRQLMQYTARVMVNLAKWI